MHPLTKMIQDTKVGTSNSLQKDKANTQKSEEPSIANTIIVSGPTRDELNQFLENVAVSKAMSLNGESPEVEAPRSVIEYYNRNNIKGFDDVGYFVIDGVRVYEMGKVDEAKRRDALTMEEKNHGGKK